MLENRKVLLTLYVIVAVLFGVLVYLTVDDHLKVDNVIVQSRLEGCEGQERLRSVVREELAEEIAQRPQTLKLLHITNTKEVQALTAAHDARLRAASAPVNCMAYSHKLNESQHKLVKHPARSSK